MQKWNIDYFDIIFVIKKIPEAYQSLEIPKVLQIDPATISTNKETWIEEWLNAS